MIWSIVHKPEMADGTEPIFRYYREALGKENVSLAVVDDGDTLDFVSPGDTILVRSVTEKLQRAISMKDARNTLENHLAYSLANDKAALSLLLSANGIPVPTMYDSNLVINGKTYFVKPRFGSDSRGVDEGSICRTAEEVAKRIILLGEDCIVEDFIEGSDCTVACWVDNGEVQACAIQIECEGSDGNILTYDGKYHEREYCSAIHDCVVESLARKIFGLMSLRHYARIDFRKDKNGRYYVIDVNLIPGLGPVDHFSKSLLLCKNYSYRDTLNAIVNTATKSQRYETTD